MIYSCIINNMFILYLLMIPLYVYSGNFTSQSIFDIITHNFQLPHEKMGIIMHKHINNHTIPDNHNIVNQDERYLSNSQIDMIEIHGCGLESSNTMRSYVFSVRVNYCFKCSITSSALADINSCKYNVVNTSPNNFIWDFHTYTDTSCSIGDINQFDYNDVLNECYNNVKVIYTPNFQLDFTIPGLIEVEYSDTSCSTPFTFQIQGYVKELCIQHTSGSMKTIDCTNNNLQIRAYPTSDCSGNTYVDQSETTDTCYVDNYSTIWYDYITSSAVIVYSDEHLRTGRFCSSLYSPIINTNPTPYPTVGNAIIPPINIDKGSCDTCPVYHMWEVKCGTFGTANTDIMCSETDDQFTCCSSTGDDCCVANGGTITVLILGIIMSIGACAYKCCGCPTKQQIANITKSTPSVLDTKALPFKKKYTPTPAQCGNELIKTTIKPQQSVVQATPSSMEEGIPLAEATIIPVEQTKKKKSKRKR
jgi:hypothetical protein